MALAIMSLLLFLLYRFLDAMKDVIEVKTILGAQKNQVIAPFVVMSNMIMVS